MNSLMTRLRLLLTARSMDRDARNRRRELERELSDFSSPADRLEIEEIVSRYGSPEADRVQRILDRPSE
jgi:hypothetical protein